MWCASVVGVQTDASAHRLLPSAMCNNNENEWPVHSSMLSLHDLCVLPRRRDYHLLFPVVWFLAAYRDGIHDRTMTACDAWCLTMKIHDIWQEYAKLCRIFWPFLELRYLPANDVISGVFVDPTGLKVRVKFSDSRLNRSRDIRLPHFVTNNDDVTGLRWSSHKGFISHWGLFC